MSFRALLICFIILLVIAGILVLVKLRTRRMLDSIDGAEGITTADQADPEEP